MKKEVIETVSHDIERANDFVANKDIVTNKQSPLFESEQPKVKQQEIDDADIPPFLRKIKRSRF